MQDYQQRVVDEKAQLDEKITKLAAFIDGDIFKTLHEDERVNMKLQLYFMQGYTTVLAKRIERYA